MPERIQSPQYLTYDIQRSREREEGIIALPIAGLPPRNCSLVRLHAPIETEIISWIVAREGAPPVAPSPNCLNANPNRVFLRGSQSAAVPVQIMVAHLWLLAGTYVWAIPGPEGLDSAFYLGKNPWEAVGVDYNYIPRESFVAGIVSKLSQRDPSLQLLNPIQA